MAYSVSIMVSSHLNAMHATSSPLYRLDVAVCAHLTRHYARIKREYLIERAAMQTTTTTTARPRKLFIAMMIIHATQWFLVQLPVATECCSHFGLSCIFSSAYRFQHSIKSLLIVWIPSNARSHLPKYAWMRAIWAKRRCVSLLSRAKSIAYLAGYNIGNSGGAQHSLHCPASEEKLILDETMRTESLEVLRLNWYPYIRRLRRCI